MRKLSRVSGVILIAAVGYLTLSSIKSPCDDPLPNVGDKPNPATYTHTHTQIINAWWLS